MIIDYEEGIKDFVKNNLKLKNYLYKYLRNSSNSYERGFIEDIMQETFIHWVGWLEQSKGERPKTAEYFTIYCKIARRLSFTLLKTRTRISGVYYPVKEWLVENYTGIDDLEEFNEMVITYDTEAIDSFIQSKNRITEREQVVYNYLKNEYSVKEISELEGVTQDTIRDQRMSLRKKVHSLLKR